MRQHQRLYICVHRNLVRRRRIRGCVAFVVSPEDEPGLSGDSEPAEQASAASLREGHPSFRVASLTNSSASSGCAAVSSLKLFVTYRARAASQGLCSDKAHIYLRTAVHLIFSCVYG